MKHLSLALTLSLLASPLAAAEPSLDLVAPISE